MRRLNIKKIQSVDRAVNILNVFLLEEARLTIDEICQATGLSKATAYRLLYTLESRGLIHYDTETHHYSLGLKLIEYGNQLAASLDIVKEAEDILTDLHRQTRQTVLMAVREGDDLVYVFKREIEVGLKYSSSVGQRRPLTYGALGKALMAYLPAETVEPLLAKGIPALTQYTLTDDEDIRRQMEQTRKEGVVVETNETTLGVTGIGAPVFESGGRPMAAIGIIWPSVQLEPGVLTEAKKMLADASRQISRRMGYHAPRDTRR